MAPSIGIGCHVEGKFGCLHVVEAPSGHQEQAVMKAKQIQQTREIYTGIVIALAPDQNWVVFWISIK